MQTTENKKKSFLLPYTKDNIHPGFSVDCVILSFYKRKIRVLLNKFRYSNCWQLPGGFMFKGENAEEAATRILKSRTGLSDIYLKQFHLFSDIHRTKMEENALLVEKNKEGLLDYNEDDQWIMQRYVSLGFYAFVKYEEVQLLYSDDDIPRWFDAKDLPQLYSDHNNIIEKALQYIKALSPILPIATELLPEKFAMSDLRKTFEIIGSKELDRRNFQKKIISSGLVVQLDEVLPTTSYNPPILYSLNKKYKEHIFDLTSLLK
ncbi:MAG: NUDIX domain-containing protein [Dysgonamonadaceae bacterium]